MTARLAPGEKGNKRFWYIIRGVKNLPVVFSGVRLPDSARLKLRRPENYKAQPRVEFSILDASSANMLYQVTPAAQADNFTYLESFIRAYIDGAADLDPPRVWRRRGYPR